MTDAATLLKRNSDFRGKRGTWENHWQEIADRILQRQAEFQGTRPAGGKRTAQMMDATAALGLQRFVATTEHMVIPRAQQWHGLKASVAEINDEKGVTEFFEALTKVLFSLRYSPEANFTGQSNEALHSLGAFGTAPMMVTPNLERRGIDYKAVFLGEICFAENKSGIIDTAFREYSLTARQAVQEWSEEQLTEKIRKAAAEKPDTSFKFLSAVFPREDAKPGFIDAKNMPWASFHVAMEEKQIIKESGFRLFPYPVSRYVTAPNEVYGRSPAMTVLPDIKTLNEMERTELTAAHRSAMPPILTRDDGPTANRPKMQPNAINHGGLDEQGRPTMVPFNSGSRVEFSIEKSEQKRRSIDGAFLGDVFRTLTDNPNMTATQVLELTAQRGILMSPTMGRQQTEWLGPQIEIEIDIAFQFGMLPPMPDALLEAQGEYEIEYDSPLTQAVRAQEALSITRSLEMIAPIAEFDPTVLDNVDGDKATRQILDLGGVTSIKRDEDEVAAMRADRAEQQQMRELAEAAPPVAGAVKDLAQAGAAVNG